MARQRSPKYPNVSLPDAISRVRKVFDKDRINPLDREVVAKHMGYSGLSGASDKMLASIMQYGLLERVAKGEIRVSQQAVDIFHPETEDQKREALKVAAFAPETFKLLRDRFGPSLPSEDAMRSTLVRMEYMDRAIDPIIAAYGETLLFLKQENASESGGGEAADVPESNPMPPITGRADVRLEDATMEARGAIGTSPAGARAGQESFVIPLGSSGRATVSFPSDLDAQGFEDLKDYLDLFFKKQVRQLEADAQKQFNKMDKQLSEDDD